MLLLLLLILIPILEIVVLIKVGTVIGALNTILLLILVGILGTILAKRQGMATFIKIKTELENGRMPAEELLNAVFIFVGGILLLLPGFISDVLAFILLIPWTRYLCKRWLRHKLDQKLKSGGFLITWHN